jgi:hypothetical protein
MFRFLDQSKQAKIQWVRNPNQSNKLETNNKKKSIKDLYTGINDFKKGYQPSTNAVKDEKGDKIGLQVNADKTKYMVMSRDQNAMQYED